MLGFGRMDRSFFRRSSQDTSPLLPQHSSSKAYPLADLPPRPYSDLPSSSRSSHGSASPLRASRQPHVQFYPPPPIVNSVLLNPYQPTFSRTKSPSTSRIRSLPTVPTTANPLMSLSRREKAIQLDLQLLLDAQSIGLSQGRISDQHVEDRGSDAGSSTPTSRSLALSPSRSQDERSRSSNRGVVPVRQPQKKKIGLNSARRGILSAMKELSAVKEHEMSIVDEEMSALRAILSKVSLWENKITSFEQEMRRISEGTEGREIIELKAEKSAVEMEIRELEDRLLGLRARERHLSSRIEEAGNRKEAELSSFREGRRETEAEVKEFLKRPPVFETTVAVITKNELATRRESDLTVNETFLSLPPKRRTLGIASDWLSASLKILTSYRSDSDKEKLALEQGAQTWSAAISAVATFETALRKQMNGGNGLEIQNLKDQLSKMDDVVRDLEQKAGDAERKGWNLLICALGAELEAFKEGRALLEGVLRTLDPSPGDGEGTENLEADGDGRQSSGLDSGVFHDAKENPGQSAQGSAYLNNGHGNGSLAGANGFKEPGSQGDGLGDVGARNTGPEKEKEEDEHENRNGRRGRAPSPYRSETESEDDGPPEALLVGIEDEDDE